MFSKYLFYFCRQKNKGLRDKAVKWGLCKLFSCFHSKEYILVKLRGNTAKTLPEYTPGDHIAVFPENSDDDVKLICERVRLPDGVNVDTTIRLVTSKASHMPGLSFIPLLY